MKAKILTIALVTMVLGLLVASCAPAPAPTPTPKPAAPTPTPVPVAPTPTPVPPTPTPKPKVFKVGVLGPFTGPAARVGEEFKGALTMAFEDVDWTIGDYKIELVWMDSESDPEGGKGLRGGRHQGQDWGWA